MGDTRGSGLWSAGGGASSRRDDHLNEDLDRLDELEDPVVQGERVKFSGSKNSKNLKSEDQILERKRTLFGAEGP